mgnify:CR=1 FL=1
MRAHVHVRASVCSVSPPCHFFKLTVSITSMLSQVEVSRRLAGLLRAKEEEELEEHGSSPSGVNSFDFHSNASIPACNRSQNLSHALVLIL